MKRVVSRVELAERIADDWNSLNLDYVVAHGLEPYPQALGRDLDVVVPSESSAVQAARAAVRCVASAGWRSLLVRKSPWGLYQVVAVRLDCGTVTTLPIDLLYGDQLWTHLPVQAFTTRQILALPRKRTGPFVVSPDATFIKAIVRPLLIGDVDRFQEPRRLQEWPQQASASQQALLASLFGDRLGSRYVEDLNAGPEAFRQSWSSYRKALIKYELASHPLRSVQVLLGRANVLARRYLFQSGLRFGISGPHRLVAAAGRGAANNLESGFFTVKLVDLTSTGSAGGIAQRLRRSLRALIGPWSVDRMLPVSEFTAVFYLQDETGQKPVNGITKIVLPNSGLDSAIFELTVRVLEVFEQRFAPDHLGLT